MAKSTPMTLCDIGASVPTIPSGEINYETHGGGTPVLLVSGLGGVGSYWAPNLPAFSARHQAIVHDHRALAAAPARASAIPSIR